MFDLTLSMTAPQILSPWLSVLTKSIKAEFPPPPLSTTCTPPQKIVLFLPFEPLLSPVAIPSALQHLVPANSDHPPLLLPHALLIHLTSVGIIVITLTELRNVEHPVSGWETSCPAGGCFHPTCRLYRIFSSVSSRQAFISSISCGLRCLSLGFSSTTFHFSLWSEASYS